MDIDVVDDVSLGPQGAEIEDAVEVQGIDVSSDFLIGPPGPQGPKGDKRR